MGKPRQHPDPRFTNEARVVDDDGRRVPPGTVGELIIRNPASMRGYFEDPERTAEAMRDGWLYTGDYARRDADGFFCYVDRKKDIVRRRGENVSSRRGRARPRGPPGGRGGGRRRRPVRADRRGGARVRQLLRRAPPRAAELAAWCSERLADFKVPRYVQLVDELPKTATGRLQKGRVREGFADPKQWWDGEAR